MSRIKIDLPNDWHFETRVAVRITDLNYGGHVGNQHFLAYMHEARVQWLHIHGWSEMNLEGVGLIMSDASIRFRREVFYGNNLLIKLAVADLGMSSFTLVYGFYEADSMEWVGSGQIGMAFMDYQTRKLATMPQAFRNTFSS
ncbi:MAG: thioesterase family protein [Bacteroidetes bacterium]|jgi:4-hydroxybenzoyl-CoA thioesterase|nr:thioesterase family protein [Bacteroidota bacterium]